MKLLLVLQSDETYNLISVFVKPLGFELIHYNHILKAMDNIDEVDPCAIVISARDFPRHWKTMVQFVRSARSKEDCPIILLKGSNFPQEEMHKASYLGVSGIVLEALDNSAEIERLQGILSRYLPVDEKRRSRRFRIESWEKLGFTFVSPAAKTLVTGAIKTISSTGLSFLPDYPELMGEIALNMDLNECSLRAGDSILSPVCRLTRTGRIVSMEFLSFPAGEQKTLEAYIESRPILERRNSE